MHGQPLRIAMAPGEDLRPHVGLADEGIVRRHRAVVLQPHDLAAEIVEILRPLHLIALARGDIHQAGAVEGDARAEMQPARRPRQGLEDRRDAAQGAVAQLGARHGGRRAARRPRPNRIGKGRGSAQSSDAGRHRAVRPGRGHRPWARRPAARAPAGRWRTPEPARPLGHQDPAVGQEGDRPGLLEVAGQRHQPVIGLAAFKDFLGAHDRRRGQCRGGSAAVAARMIWRLCNRLS